MRTLPAVLVAAHAAVIAFACHEIVAPEPRAPARVARGTAATSLDSLSLAELQLLAQMEDSLIRADRKSTRLNSSHQITSYAVFCLKKKIKSLTLAFITFLLIYYTYILNILFSCIYSSASYVVIMISTIIWSCPNIRIYSSNIEIT